MSCNQPPEGKNNFPYIEPSIRVIAGFLLSVIGVLLYFNNDWILILVALLLFISLNLFQSGITHFCMMEKFLKLFGFRSELDEIKLLNEEAQRSVALQKNYMDTLDMLNEAVIELSPDGRILSASEGWFRLINHSASSEQDPSDSLVSFVHQADKSLVLKMLKVAVVSGEKVHRIRFRFQRNDHEEHWIGGKFMLEKLEKAEVRIRGVLHDITDTYMQEKRIKHMAMHDALTDLPNRILLEEKMEHALIQAKRNNTLMGLLFIDLDNFKQINDVHGHKTGDHLLVSVSNIMRDYLRASDTLARWGGDEFVIVLPELKQASDMRDVAVALMHKLEAGLNVEDFDVTVTLSIGGAIYPSDALTTESLLVQADKALYFAKEQGRNNVQIFTDLRDSELGYYDFDMTNRFSQAVKDGDIQVHYQTIVSASEHRICGIEALARWYDDQSGWVGPGTFIPMAENLGLIQELGRQVLKRAVEDFSSVAHDHDITLSVNLSNRQLMQADFIVWLTELVQTYELRPQQLKLEITESIAQIGIVKAKEILETLRLIGFGISLDDFGTGYSSLSHLHELPIDELKIDMSFVHRYACADGRIMLETICAMGRFLRLELVAEGVESQECNKVLTQLGVNKLQGYYFSRPKPWDEVVQLHIYDSEKPKLMQAKKS
ncbi:diguanylate cyclase/phosphodiesterase (GGDEF & EAL domains) with PAS/PAC sensor(s) [hydrothermal vent metagenome]|uniref:Diguanylate cyclase/phosphodiesterase (GGDEF & EAL domains) with PAS/PAC sensor(S) n=1 Tax=hydrothermal vent metagenome TaxID=652676 RepID=A0A3B1A7D3_9ZZZZ